MPPRSPAPGVALGGYVLAEDLDGLADADLGAEGRTATLASGELQHSQVVV